MIANIKSLTKSKLFTDVIWNYIGYLIPIIMALPVLGVLSRILGVERFGLFTMIFAIFGYANIFDLGFSRALVRVISINNRNKKIIKEYLVTATMVIVPLSMIPLFSFLIFNVEIASLLGISDDVKQDGTDAIFILSFAFPFVISFSLWQSYFEGLERFRELSIIKTINSAILVLLPLLFVYYDASLKNAVFGLLCARIFISILVISLVTNEVGKYKVRWFEKDKLKDLLSYGGWLTLTNLITPIFNIVDKFILSSLSGAEKLALYSAPVEVINRFLIIPGIIARTLFPRFARGEGESDKHYVEYLLSAIMLLIVTVIYLFSDIFIGIWLGSDYIAAAESLRILLIGLFFCSLAQIPYMKIQAAGYSKLAAKIHLAEVIPYVIVLYILIDHYSYYGAALAWTFRTVIDCIAFKTVEMNLKKGNRLS
ncbi:flippase [Enterobacter hormaechei]|uniref:flippase n=2 Tax=Enterobacter hormaechei TaxID=158836 RepID=UPI0005F8C460|nr:MULTISPECIES: flippase [Enterobacteriaceae]KJX15632.1 hypothetical protein SG74_23275 [Enterobacter hormaechei subsp. xiangfangensis]PCD71545.1 flippase [Escherichia coli]